MYNLNTPIWQLTVGEFIELQQRFRPSAPQPSADTPRKNLVYGIEGIAGLFSCSKTTAQKIKNSGTIDKAITQIGNKIIVDADLALKLAGESMHKKGRAR